jgi:hypothetical protein
MTKDAFHRVRVMDLQSKPDPTPQPIKVESKEGKPFSKEYKSKT